jgi:hypothetical protein
MLSGEAKHNNRIVIDQMNILDNYGVFSVVVTQRSFIAWPRKKNEVYIPESIITPVSRLCKEVSTTVTCKLCWWSYALSQFVIYQILISHTTSSETTGSF